MDGLQLRDEAVRDRIRAAEEFLDPSMMLLLIKVSKQLLMLCQQMTPEHVVTEQRLWSCSAAHHDDCLYPWTRFVHTAERWPRASSTLR